MDIFTGFSLIALILIEKYEYYGENIIIWRYTNITRDNIMGKYEYYGEGILRRNNIMGKYEYYREIRILCRNTNIMEICFINFSYI